MTTEQLEDRLTWIESLMLKANPKDLPYLNATYQRLMDRLVEMDLAAQRREEG